MNYQNRKAKLVRVIQTADTMDPEHLAEFIMQNGFDYTVYVATLASVRTIEKHKEKLKVSFD